MKKVEAIIRPEKLEDIKDVLKSLHLNGLTVSQVMGCGNQKGWTEYVRGTETDIHFLPKVKVELVVREPQLEEVIAAIVEKAKTGEVGDGKIFVFDVADAIRIRTGERAEDALK